MILTVLKTERTVKLFINLTDALSLAIRQIFCTYVDHKKFSEVFRIKK